MIVLLDTHSFLWFAMGSSKLSQAARSLIEDVNNERRFSIASLWEMAIKISIGKLTLEVSFDTLIPKQIHDNGIELVEVRHEHVSKIVSMPFHHKDPFDRMLVAQCLTEQWPIVSSDPLFDSDGVQRLW